MVRGKPLRTFYSKVAGVTYTNDNGTSRQAILGKCHKGEYLILTHEPVPQDEYAVKVSRENGEQIGWLNQEVAYEIAPRLDRGGRVEAIIAELTGGGGGFFSKKQSRGCNIIINRYSLR